MPKEDKLAKAKQLLDLINNGLTKGDFVAAFKNVVDRVKRFEAALTRDFKALSDTLTKRTDKAISEAEKQIEAKLATIKPAEKGDKGDNPTKDELIALIYPLIPDAIPGNAGAPGDNGSPDLAEDIRNKLELLDGDERLSSSAVRGLDEAIQELKTGITKSGQQVGWGAHPLAIQGSGTTKVKVARIINFTGATVTHSPQGVTTVAITGGSTLSGTQEKSTTTPNGSTTTFTFAHPPAVIVWAGAIQTLTDDYTVSGNNITFSASAGVPQIGDKIINIYA